MQTLKFVINSVNNDSSESLRQDSERERLCTFRYVPKWPGRRTCIIYLHSFICIILLRLTATIFVSVFPLLRVGNKVQSGYKVAASRRQSRGDLFRCNRRLPFIEGSIQISVTTIDAAFITNLASLDKISPKSAQTLTVLVINLLKK